MYALLGVVREVDDALGDSRHEDEVGEGDADQDESDLEDRC